MHTITHYKILNAVSITGLEDKMKSILTEGWQPLGGVCYGDEQFIQAVVKYEQENI